MSCEKIKEKLNLYLDDVLPLEEKLKVEKHLDKCKNCAQQLKELKEISSLLREITVPEARIDFSTLVMGNINLCPEVRRKLSTYLDALLKPGEKKIVEKHLKVCSRCSRELSELRTLNTLLKEIPAPELPVDLSQRIEEHLSFPSLPRYPVKIFYSTGRGLPVNKILRGLRWAVFAGAAAGLVFLLVYFSTLEKKLPLHKLIPQPVVVKRPPAEVVSPPPQAVAKKEEIVEKIKIVPPKVEILKTLENQPPNITITQQPNNGRQITVGYSVNDPDDSQVNVSFFYLLGADTHTCINVRGVGPIATDTVTHYTTWDAYLQFAREDTGGYLCIQAVDSANNITNVYTNSFILDTKPPRLQAQTYFMSDPQSGDLTVKLASVWTDANGSNATSAFDISANALSFWKGEEAGTRGLNPTITYSFTPALDGNDYLYARSKLTDNFGNVSAYSESSQKLVIPKSPSIISVTDVFATSMTITFTTGGENAPVYYCLNAVSIWGNQWVDANKNLVSTGEQWVSLTPLLPPYWDSSSIVVTGFQPATTYNLNLRAANPNNTTTVTPYSASVSVYTQPLPLAAPIIVNPGTTTVAGTEVFEGTTSVNKWSNNEVTLKSWFTDTDQASVYSYYVTFKVSSTVTGDEFILVSSKTHQGTGELYTGTVKHSDVANWVRIDRSSSTYTVTYTWNPSTEVPNGLYSLYFRVNDSSDTQTDGYGNNQKLYVYYASVTVIALPQATQKVVAGKTICQSCHPHRNRDWLHRDTRVPEYDCFTCHGTHLEEVGMNIQLIRSSIVAQVSLTNTSKSTMTVIFRSTAAFTNMGTLPATVTGYGLVSVDTVTYTKGGYGPCQVCHIEAKAKGSTAILYYATSTAVKETHGLSEGQRCGQCHSHMPAPEVTSVTPVYGSTTSATVLTIEGKHFDMRIARDNSVKLSSGTKVGWCENVDWLNATKLEATISTTTLSNLSTGPYLVTVRNPEGKEGTWSSTFWLYAVEQFNPPTISTFTPSSGPPGTLVTIGGTYFLNSGKIEVKFGTNTASSVYWISNSTVQAVVSTTTPQGYRMIYLTNSAGRSCNTANLTPSSFTVTAPVVLFATPVVTSIEPKFGSAKAKFEIYGSSFGTTRGQVKIYSDLVNFADPLTFITCDDSNEIIRWTNNVIEVKIPSFLASRIVSETKQKTSPNARVIVVGAGGSTSTWPTADNFTLICLPPVVESITPKNSAQGEKDVPVTVKGKWFSPGLSLYLRRAGEVFNIEATEINVESTSTIKAKFSFSVDQSTGDWRVFVCNPDLQEPITELLFEVLPAPKIISVEPNWSSSDTAKAVTISGTGFRNQDYQGNSFTPKIYLSTNTNFVPSIEVTTRTYESVTVIKATFPALTGFSGYPLGWYRLKITNPIYYGSVTIEQGYKYEPIGASTPPAIISISPTEVYSNVNTTITITGANFISTPTVKIGIYDAINETWNSKTQMKAIVPAGLPPGTTYVQVINQYGTPNASTSTLEGAITILKGAYACNDCHYAPTISTGSHKVHYNTTLLPTKYGETTNNSAGDKYQFGCGKCHNANHQNDVNSGTSTVNAKVVEVVFDTFNAFPKNPGANYSYGTSTSYVQGPDGKYYAWNNITCNLLYCHGNLGSATIGISSTPVWGKGWTGNRCENCHKITQATLSGASHRVHTSSRSYSGVYTCITCHYDTVSSSANVKETSFHTNGWINIRLNPDGNRIFSTSTYAGANSTASTTLGSYETCSNIYCHSSVQGASSDTVTNASAVTYKTPTWGSSLYCSSCHDYTLASGTYTVSGSHSKHTGSPWYISCSTCHYNAGASSATLHADKLIQVTTGSYYAYEAGLSSAPQTAYGGCSNLPSCHGAGRPRWGTTLTCLDCHAAAEDLDDYNPSNGTTARISTSTVYGWYGSKHYQYNVTCTTTNCHDSATSHYDSNNPFRLKYSTYYVSGANAELGCKNCHDGVTATNALRHSLATTGGDSWNQITNSTDNYKCVDCHDPHRDRNVFVSTAVSKLVQSLIARDSSNQRGQPRFNVNLNTAPVNFVLSSDLQGRATDYIYTVGTDTSTRICQTCHQSNKYYTLSWTSATAHYGSGNKCTNCHAHSKAFAASCVICHAAPPVVADNDTHRSHYYWSASTPTEYGGANWTKVMSVGTTQYIYGCGICHKSPDHGATVSKDTFTVEVIFDTITFPMNVYSTYTYAGTSWSTHTYTQSGQGYKYNNNAQCKNNYCHGQFVSTTTSNNTIGISSVPVWGGSMPLDPGTKCRTACHNISTGTVSGASHRKHVSTYPYTCDYCHYDTASSTYTIRYSSHHVNGKVDWDFNEGKSPLILASSKYKGEVEGSTGTAGTYTGYNCTNFYCHSNATPIQGTLSYSSATWGTTLTCSTGCHSSVGTGGGTNLSMAHKKHTSTSPVSDAYGYKCYRCHKETVKLESISEINFSSHHVNGNKTVAFSTHNAYAGYNSTVYRCTNTYCHSAGTTTWNNGTPTSSVLWTSTGGVIGCNSCHRGPDLSGPNYTYSNGGKPNAHQGHTAYRCNTCHYSVMTSTWSIAFATAHVNNVYDSTPMAPYSFSYKAATTPAPSRCDNISCHGNNYALWTTTVAVKCSNCHMGTTADVDDYKYENSTGTLANIKQSEWETTGHGRGSGVYDSGNPAAKFDVSLTTGDPCLYCHTKTVLHGSTTNFFRLANYDTATTTGMNNNCGICHYPNSTGYDPPDLDGVVYKSTNSTEKVATAHWTSTHTTEGSNTDGGKFCWDCHDPHGDFDISGSTIGYMVHRKPVELTAGTDTNNYGIPYLVIIDTIAFAKAKAGSGTSYDWGDYVDTTTPFTDGLCQECHGDNEGVKYFTKSSSSGHMGPTTKCTSCHSHDNKFEATCLTCHLSPPNTGAHRKHYAWSASTPTSYGGTANLSSSNTYIYECGKCHQRNLAQHDTAAAKKSTQTADIDFDNTTYPKNPYSTYTIVGTSYSYYAGGDYIFQWGPLSNCSTSYCHGAFMYPQTNVTIGISSRPVWGGKMPTDPGTKCRTACHNYSIFTTTSGKSHSIHVSSQGYTCTFCHYDTASSTYSVRYSSYHVNGWMNINLGNEVDTRIFSTSTYAGANSTATTTLGSYTGKFCTNIYCHSTVQGSSITTVTQSPVYRSVSWSSGTLNCESCHYTSSTTATANMTGSHAAHIKSTFAYTCDKCHPYTNPRLGADPKKHADKLIQVTTGNYAGTVSSAPQTAYGSCSSLPNCHGQDTPAWGTKIATDCVKCHLGGVADVDDYVFNNGKLAMISSDSIRGWFGTGHGRTVGTYDSGNPAAGFASTCTYCHTTTVAHGSSTNPFRLANIEHATYGRNYNCLICHRTGEPGTGGKNATVTKADLTAHWGTKHSTETANTTDGGYFCWDCHDPHGDWNVTNSTVVARMFQVAPVRLTRGTTYTADAYGVPYSTAADNGASLMVDFRRLKYGTADWEWYDYIDTTKEGAIFSEGACQVCHSSGVVNYFHQTSSSPVSPHPTSGGGCISCHSHTDNFKPAGCYGCHGNTTNQTYWPDGSTAHSANDAGSHWKHVKAIDNYDANCDTYTDAGQKNICKFCHVSNPGDPPDHNNGITDLKNFKNIAGTLETVETSSVAWYVKASSSCQKADCHAEKPTYNWYATIVSSCGQCHITGTAFNPGTLAHSVHVSTYGYTCTECHPNNYLVTPSSYAHTNAKVDMWWSSGTVNISTVAFYDKYRNASSTTGFTPSWIVATSTFGPCYNLYCHRPSSWTAIRWDQNFATVAPGIGKCDMCHNLPPRFSDAIKSSYTHYGDHTLGATGTVNASTWVFSAGQNAGEIGGYNFGCKKCHPDPTSDASKHAKGMAVRTSSMTANLTFDATVDPKNPNVTWSTGTIARKDSRGYWFTNTRCSSTFCHGTTLPSGMRTGVNITTPTWNANLAAQTDSACGACHDTAEAKSGSHAKHVSPSSYSYRCELCHYDTAESSWTVRRSSHHVDGKASWNLGNESKPSLIWSTSTYKGFNSSNTVVFSSYGATVAISSCSNLYCHSKGKRTYETPIEVPRWGATFPVSSTCTWCHGGVANYTVLTATHGIHVSTTITAGKREYDYTCETCHKDTVSGKTVIKNYTLHVSSIANVVISTYTSLNRTFPGQQNATYERSTGQCKKVYCHSDGTAYKTGTLGSWATPQWLIP